MMTTWLLMLALAAAPASGEKAAAPAAATQGKRAAKPGKKAEAPKPPPAEAEAPPLPPPPPPPFQWKVPGLVDWVDSPGVQVSDGVPMVLEMARSSLPMEQLIQRFADSFEASGLYIPPDPFQESILAEPRLTALDTERMLAYTVVFQPNPDRTTTLYLGTADMSRYEPGGGAKLEWAPLMPGAEKLMRTELEVAQSAMYSVRAKPSEVLAFYRQALVPQGFKETEPGAFRRGNEVLHVFTEVDGPECMVGLSRRLSGADEEPPAVAPAPTP